jgi:hypothetical protein
LEVVDRPKQLREFLFGDLLASFSVAIQPPPGAFEDAVQVAVVVRNLFELSQRPLVGIEGDTVDDRGSLAATVGRYKALGKSTARPTESADDQLHSNCWEPYHKKCVFYSVLSGAARLGKLEREQ